MSCVQWQMIDKFQVTEMFLQLICVDSLRIIGGNTRVLEFCGTVLRFPTRLQY
jgi:hypothetical protein